MDKYDLADTRYVYMCKDERHMCLTRACENTTHSEVLHVLEAALNTQ
jgi:hypothetical protein